MITNILKFIKGTSRQYTINHSNKSIETTEEKKTTEDKLKKNKIVQITPIVRPKLSNHTIPDIPAIKDSSPMHQNIDID